ncbi:hypothetical protein J3R82DRAFT_7338 [Butyriboletus roseoflavus]|nr:hypothetical protein J3R82DRAFT_7338 [Butyriboletus roseoflavus]
MPPTQTLPSLQAAFAKHLFIHGYPLWNPDPDLLPPACQSVGLRIGDVGTVDEQGRFDLFFNIFEPPPGNGGSPPNFPPIEQEDARCGGEDIPPREVASSPATMWDVDEVEAVMDDAGVRYASFLPYSSHNRATAADCATSRRTTEYSATLSDDGSHIILPQGAQLFQLGLHHRRLFEDYAREHGADWLERFRDRLGWPRSNSIYLLTGYYKTCSWSIASFSMHMAANTDPVRTHCKLVEVDELTIREASVWQPTGRFQRKIGPPPNRQGRHNQTVFIRAVTVTPNLFEQVPSGQREAGLLDKIFSFPLSLNSPAGDSNQETATETPKSNVKIEHVPNITQASHPSEIINRYLLAKELSAKIAVTHDSQWIAMLKSSEGSMNHQLTSDVDRLGDFANDITLDYVSTDEVTTTDLSPDRSTPRFVSRQFRSPTLRIVSSHPSQGAGSPSSSHYASPSHSRRHSPARHRNRKKGKSPTSSPSRSIADAFKEYIDNELPARFIDTSTLQLVSRKSVLRVLKDDIAKVDEEQIQERMSQSDPLATHQSKRATVLRQIIQEVVKYDVLSHRRDEIAGEPTYRDICDRNYSSMHKFTSSKVVQFCMISRSLGRKLAWVDTCCVDQSNTAELSEDYSSDVQVFYNRNWQSFNHLEVDDDRKDVAVAHHLENFTGICKAVLTADNSHGIHGRTFWEIISWASRRQTTRIEDRAYCLVGLLHIDLTIYYGEGTRAFSRLVETIAAKNPSWDVFAWFGQPSVDHFALPSSPASYPRFEAHMVEGRAGVQEFTITPDSLFLKSLPPIPMELCSVVAPDEPGHSFHVNLKPRSDKESLLGRYGDLVVECGADRLGIIRGARQLSACIINHHPTQSRQQGKLVVGADYICFLLYSESGEDDEIPWMKLCTDNLLRISCVGMPDTTGSDTVIREPDLKDTQPASVAGRKTFTLSLVTTSIRSPTSK